MAISKLENNVKLQFLNRLKVGRLKMPHKDAFD